MLALSDLLFTWWHRVRDGTLQRRTFRTRAGWLRQDVQIVLGRGRVCRCAKTAAVCRELLAVEAALWTFAEVEGVEPTNNHAERMLRPAVLWRKGSFGCASDTGCRFVERMWSSPRKVDTGLTVIRVVHSPPETHTPATSDGVGDCKRLRCTRRWPYEPLPA